MLACGDHAFQKQHGGLGPGRLLDLSHVSVTRKRRGSLGLRRSVQTVPSIQLRLQCGTRPS